MNVHVTVEDAAFAAFAADRGLLVAPVAEGDDFLRPMLHSIGRRLAEYPKSVLPRPPAKGIRLGFVEEPSPNTFVESWRAHVIIGVHTGLLLSLLEATVQLQDDIGMFDAGFGSGPVPPAPIDLALPLGLTSYLRHRLGLGEDESVIREAGAAETGASRRAMNFLGAGLQFACLHEFGHLACGHLAWLRGRGRVARLFENPEEAASVLPRADSALRFFEHEADIFALETLLRSAMTRPPQQTSATDKMNEITTTMLAFLFVALGWIGLEQTIGRTADATHPDPRDRLFALPLALTGLLEESVSFRAPLTEAVRRCQAILARVIVRCPAFRAPGAVFDRAEVGRVEALIDWMRRMDMQTAARSAGGPHD